MSEKKPKGNHMLVRHKVSDFEKWKSVYDEHRPARETAGLKDLYLWRNEGDPSEIILLFEVSDVVSAKAFTNSFDAKEKMQAAGVLGSPDVVLLSES
jgi:hypothetical protein